MDAVLANSSDGIEHVHPVHLAPARKHRVLSRRVVVIRRQQREVIERNVAEHVLHTAGCTGSAVGAHAGELNPVVAAAVTLRVEEPLSDGVVYLEVSQHVSARGACTSDVVCTE